jgi:hypothetical protein
MERGWIETIQLLGLDVVLAVTLALAAAGWVAGRLAERGAPESSARKPGSVAAVARPAGLTDASAWPPGPWRTSH